MSYCHVSHQISEHCNQSENYFCWHCERLMSEDEDSFEVVVKFNGLQSVCEDCYNKHFKKDNDEMEQR